MKLSTSAFINQPIFNIPQNLTAVIRYFEKTFSYNKKKNNIHVEYIIQNYSEEEQQEIYVLAKERQDFELSARTYAKEIGVSVQQAKKMLKNTSDAVNPNLSKFAFLQSKFNKVVKIYAEDYNLSFYQAKQELSYFLSKDLEGLGLTLNKNLNQEANEDELVNEENTSLYLHLENKLTELQSQLSVIETEETKDVLQQHNKDRKLQRVNRQISLVNLLKTNVKNTAEKFAEQNLTVVINQSVEQLQCSVSTVRQDVRDLALRTLL